MTFDEWWELNTNESVDLSPAILNEIRNIAKAAWIGSKENCIRICDNVSKDMLINEDALALGAFQCRMALRGSP
jgi:hypothetical protein